MNKDTIIRVVKHFNEEYVNSGFQLVSLFGSYAKGTYDVFSDIDLTYRIDHDRFYKDNAFAKLEELEKIQKELEKMFHKKVDLIAANTKNYRMQQSLKNEQILI